MYMGIDFCDPANIVSVILGFIAFSRILPVVWMLSGNRKVLYIIPEILVVVLVLAHLDGRARGLGLPPWTAVGAAAVLLIYSQVRLFLPGPLPRHGQHYVSVRSKVGGMIRTVYLLECEAYSSGLSVTYQCPARISSAECDRVDTRLRAFIACSIFDVACAEGLTVVEGPPHGIRPSWIVQGYSIPIGLQNASFDPDKRIFNLQVGPVLLGGEELSSELQRLLWKGFVSRCMVVRV